MPGRPIRKSKKTKTFKGNSLLPSTKPKTRCSTKILPKSKSKMKKQNENMCVCF